MFPHPIVRVFHQNADAIVLIPDNLSGLQHRVIPQEAKAEQGRARHAVQQFLKNSQTLLACVGTEPPKVVAKDTRLRKANHGIF